MTHDFVGRRTILEVIKNGFIWKASRSTRTGINIAELFFPAITFVFLLC